jgi:small subunit ribosomal protein S16
MVKLRLKRYGRTHQPVYRLGAVDSRAKRDGKVIEELGVYDPTFKDDAKQIQFNQERCQHWLNVGAQPSETDIEPVLEIGRAHV